MKIDERLGDKMPVNRNVKWGDMKAGESHLSDKWHNLEHSEPHTSEKWIGMEPTKGHMSDKWVEIEAGTSPQSDRWHEMKQEHRIDPYSMAPSEVNRTQPFKEMKKEKPDNRVERAIQHNEFGKTREI